MNKSTRASLSLLLLASIAMAQTSQDAREVTLPVGKTVKVDVGPAIGLNCDDPGVVDAKLVTSKDGQSNNLVLKGRASGVTYCRAGQAATGHTVLLHIVVRDAD